MTEREEARQQATKALQRASELRDRGGKIAEAWRKSQRDNNFRMMLRGMGKVVKHGSS